MIIFKFIPLFAFILAAYWGLHQSGHFPDKLNDIIFGLRLPSGEEWAPTWGGLITVIGLITLYIEIFKSTRTSSISIVWTAGEKGDSTFLLLTIMSFIDVIAGFTITISTARRDFGLGGN